MKHGLDCPCYNCESIRELIRGKVKSGDVHLVGLENDKRKIMQEKEP